MLSTFIGYFIPRNMDKSPAPVHPLGMPETEPARVDMRIWTPPPQIETSTAIRSLENAREKWVSNVATRDADRTRRGTSTRSASASQAALQRDEMSRRLDSPERRSDSSRKRRYTDEDQLRTTIAESKKENSELSAQLYSARNDLAEALKKSQINQQKIQTLLADQSTVLSQLHSAQKGWEAKERELVRKIGELEASNKKKDEDLRIVQSKLRSVEGKLQETAKLLEVRTADLAGVQTFLTTTDSYSGAEIIKMTESLNAEIFQAAAYMAELLEDKTTMATQSERNRNIEKYRDNLERTIKREIGEPLWTYLHKNHSIIRTDPLPLQLALQCILARWCAYCVRCFTAGSQSEFMDNLYRRIQASETQPISGRWRAITFAKIAELPGSKMHPDVIIDCLLWLLYFCGWSSGHEQSKKAMISIQNMVFAMDKMASQLKVATKEEITAMDIDVYAVMTGSPFTADMEDVYADSSAENAVSGNMAQRVLCTVGLGLRRSITKRNEAGVVERKEDIILKPKVALVSALTDDSSSRRS